MLQTSGKLAPPRLPQGPEPPRRSFSHQPLPQPHYSNVHNGQCLHIQSTLIFLFIIFFLLQQCYFQILRLSYNGKCVYISIFKLHCNFLCAMVSVYRCVYFLIILLKMWTMALQVVAHLPCQVLVVGQACPHYPPLQPHNTCHLSVRLRSPGTR